jgi:hypothetical protein
VSARIEEIRQENRSGDVSYQDIEWLCSVADAASIVIEKAGLHGHSDDEAYWRTKQPYWISALRRALRRNSAETA